MYSLLAGFVEPVNYRAVRREVFIESGNCVGEVSHLASQPLGVSVLMIGCHGR
jgi:NADH pyrophosphatase NudC (nudix superfamily)